MSSKVNWMPSCRDKMSFHGHLNKHYLHNVSFSRRTQTEVMLTCCNWHRYLVCVADYPAMSFVFVCWQQMHIRNTNPLSWAINYGLCCPGTLSVCKRSENPRLFWTSDIRYWKWILSGKFGTIVFIFGQYSLPNIYWTFLSSLHPGHY